MPEKRSGEIFAAVFFLVSFLAVAALAWQVTLNCDDYMYGRFTQEGLAGFWKWHKWHYENFNGRVLVHVLLTLQLMIGPRWYALILPGMLAYLFLTSVSLLAPQASRSHRLILAGLGMVCVGTLPVSLLRESVMWLSAAYNYIFPLVLTVAALRLALRRERLGIWQAALTVLSGATTEQFGVITCTLLGLIWLTDWITTKKCSWYRLLLVLLAGCGTLTIIFAPGTSARMVRESGGGLLSGLAPAILQRRMNSYFVLFAGAEGCVALILLFAVLSGLCAAFFGHGRRILVIGLPAASVYLLLLSVHDSLHAAIFAVCYLAVAGLVMLFSEDTRPAGVWMLALLASQFLILMTDNLSIRSTLPAVLMLTALCLSLGAVGIARCRPGMVAGGSVIAFVILFSMLLPTLRGFHANLLIDRKNEAVMRDRTADYGVLDCSGDPMFRYLTYLDSGEYLGSAIHYYHTPPDRRISYSSDSVTLAGMYGDRRFGMPALIQDGEVFFPILYTTPLLGGPGCVRDYANHCFLIPFEDRSFLITEGGEIYAYDPDTQTVGEMLGAAEPAYYLNTAYLPAEVFEQLFDLRWTYHAAENIYDLSLG